MGNERVIDELAMADVEAGDAARAAGDRRSQIPQQSRVSDVKWPTVPATGIPLA
jgi:hypothetical protein